MENTAQQFESSHRSSRTLGDEPRRNAPPPSPSYTRARAPKRLFRNPDGPIAGVATGIGDYLGVDPVVVRIAFLLAALSGFGVAAYLVCWVAMPKGARPPRQLAEQSAPYPRH